MARALGGERVPVSGRPLRPDVAHPCLAIEVKQRQRLPRWLLLALRQAEEAAGPGQTPVVVLHQRRQPYALALAVIRLRNLLPLLGPGGEGGGGGGKVIEFTV